MSMLQGRGCPPSRSPIILGGMMSRLFHSPNYFLAHVCIQSHSKWYKYFDKSHSRTTYQLGSFTRIFTRSSILLSSLSIVLIHLGSCLVPVRAPILPSFNREQICKASPGRISGWHAAFLGQNFVYLSTVEQQRPRARREHIMAPNSVGAYFQDFSVDEL